ncbi:glycosyltransferase family 2 protein [Sporolactobacillus terrae]|uniref:glycosyltransferase family 2 protein n=1 Tax=Sporolactobacillus terrae TaxID=269673 RepID=UPI001119D601|nr:glycosyltransferase family 2 protein [Sporolactobacillus terrae]
MCELTVCIVTWNSAKYIAKCLKCLSNQSLMDFELLVIDNNSSDNTVEIVRNVYPSSKIIINKKNVGFCGGHNLGITISKGQYYMPLNADIFMENDYLKIMINSIKNNKNKIGMVSGKLLRYDPNAQVKTDIIDSAGVYFCRNRRSLDRGSEEKDVGQYDNIEYVFGASGAAPLYNKKMLNDIRVNNQYFLQYFFAYREDVDLCWRAQHRNWKCIYNPNALAYHVRTNTPLKRNQMSKFVNMHSVKNRILLELQNETFYGFLKDGIVFVSYDLFILIAVIIRERSSLPAFVFIIKNLKEIISVRKQIISRSIVNKKILNKWFGRQKAIPIHNTNLKE